MKRYVKELAQDINKRTVNLFKEEVETILHYRDAGMITDFEAVYELIKLIRD